MIKEVSTLEDANRLESEGYSLVSVRTERVQKRMLRGDGHTAPWVDDNGTPVYDHKTVYVLRKTPKDKGELTIKGIRVNEDGTLSKDGRCKEKQLYRAKDKLQELIDWIEKYDDRFFDREDLIEKIEELRGE